MFKTGDVVRLKTGSHPMTVRITDKPKVLTVWFDPVKPVGGDGLHWNGPHTAVFNDYELVKLTPEEIAKIPS